MSLDVALQLVGGPLDGLYLPPTPEAKTVPRQMLVFSPANGKWTSYADRKSKIGPTDVYKIRAGARLVVSKPMGMRVVDMHYVGTVTEAAARAIEQMARNHRMP